MNASVKMDPAYLLEFFLTVILKRYGLTIIGAGLKRYQKICRGSGCGPYHRDIKEEEKMTENLYERFKERLMRVRKYFNAEYDYIMEKYIEDVKTAISQHK